MTTEVALPPVAVVAVGRRPLVAWPTVGIFVGALTAFVVSTVAYISGWVPTSVTIAVNAAVTVVMFTVVHEASHYLISSRRWVNALLGRLAYLFVGPANSYPLFAHIHREHHRFANDELRDPDAFAMRGPIWQLPLRWALAGLFYGHFFLRRIRGLPAAEVAETLVMFTASAAGLVIAVLTGNLRTLAVVFLIPWHVGIFVIMWWFNWLPHHGLVDTQRTNRYRAARVRVGMEWLFTPLMLSQNYHLVHHLHPSVPFYRYIKIWRRSEQTYLEREAAICTIYGQELNSHEFRKFKELTRKQRLVPLRSRSDRAPRKVRPNYSTRVSRHDSRTPSFAPAIFAPHRR